MAQLSSDVLAEVLVGAGVITRDQLEAVASSRSNGVEGLDETLVRLGLAREDDIFSAIARHLGLEYVPEIDREIDPALLAQLPSEFAMRHQVLPLRQEDHTLVVAMADPFDVTVLDDLRLLTSRDVRAVVTSRRKIVLWNPPLLDEALNLRKSAPVEAAEILADLVENEARTICFTKSRDRKSVV